MFTFFINKKKQLFLCIFMPYYRLCGQCKVMGMPGLHRVAESDSSNEQWELIVANSNINSGFRPLFAQTILIN